MTLFNKDINLGLILWTITTIIIGCIVIFSASQSIGSGQNLNLAYKQLIFFLITINICFLITFMNLKFIYDSSWFIYFVSIALLIAVFFIGKVSHGAQRWISLGPIVVQPSELSKLSIIIALARYMSAHIEKNKNILFIIVSFIIASVPLVLILKQPDLGTSMTIVPILLGTLFMAGIKKRYFFFLSPFVIIPLIIILLAKNNLITIDEIRNLLVFLKPYQQNRLLVFIDPNIDPQGMSYNLIQSQIAIGSGGLLGKGFLAGTQTQLKFLPERHTDFIFSVLGEEWGFIGSTILLFLYFNIIRVGLKIANLCEDFFCKLTSIGIVILLSMHILTNVGMTIGLMPITGLPLPLVSYGGSSMLTFMIAIGLLMNFYANREKTIYR